MTAPLTAVETAEQDARNYKRERDAAHIEVAARTAERDAARGLAAALEAELAEIRTILDRATSEESP